jgi:hypothetical protein
LKSKIEKALPIGRAFFINDVFIIGNQTNLNTNPQEIPTAIAIFRIKLAL